MLVTARTAKTGSDRGRKGSVVFCSEFALTWPDLNDVRRSFHLQQKRKPNLTREWSRCCEQYESLVSWLRSAGSRNRWITVCSCGGRDEGPGPLTLVSPSTWMEYRTLVGYSNSNSADIHRHERARRVPLQARNVALGRGRETVAKQAHKWPYPQTWVFLTILEGLLKG